MLTFAEIDNAEALDKYYNLLLSVTRIITSVVLSRGSQNEQTLDQARSFLVENRPLVVAMFKRQAKVGAVTFESLGVGVEELVELFVLLITVTGFLDVRGIVLCHFPHSLTNASTKKSEIPTKPEDWAFPSAVGKRRLI